MNDGKKVELFLAKGIIFISLFTTLKTLFPNSIRTAIKRNHPLLVSFPS